MISIMISMLVHYVQYQDYQPTYQESVVTTATEAINICNCGTYVTNNENNKRTTANNKQQQQQQQQYYNNFDYHHKSNNNKKEW